jgi:hypothetical protein
MMGAVCPTISAENDDQKAITYHSGDENQMKFSSMTTEAGRVDRQK